MDREQRLLQELSNAFGPSGFEESIREIVIRELAPLSDSIQTDGIGSVIASLNGTNSNPIVMLAAHMDEVGAIVKLITPEGFVKIQTLGGWLDNALINQRFIIKTRNGNVLGFTGLKTPHVMKVEDRNKIIAASDIFIDIGAKDKEDAEERLGIKPGDPIAPDSKFALLNDEKIYLGKAWDDRVGIGAMIEVFRNLKNRSTHGTIYAAATVQEEVGLRGAHTSSYTIPAQIGINLESGIASDYPGISQEEAQAKLGNGPGILLYDSSMLPNLKFRDLCIDTAKKLKINLQFEVLSGYGEDGAEIQKSRSGVPTVAITVPTRYLHNHNSVINRDDFDQTVTLVTEIIKNLDTDTVEQLTKFS